MKIAVRGGHNFLSRGASALLDETIEDRKVKDAVIKYLRSMGHSVLDVTPGNLPTGLDLAFGVRKANRWGADLFLSIHFNKAYSSYNGAIGAEGWVVSKGSSAVRVSNAICSKLATAGFKNRGTKTRGFYELRKTNMPAVIVEVCFVEATKDVAIYKKVGADGVGRLIAEGATGQKAKATQSRSRTVASAPRSTSGKTFRCITGSFADEKNANDRMKELKRKGFDSFIAIYKKDGKTTYRWIIQLVHLFIFQVKLLLGAKGRFNIQNTILNNDTSINTVI